MSQRVCLPLEKVLIELLVPDWEVPLTQPYSIYLRRWLLGKKIILLQNVWPIMLPGYS